MEQVGRLRILTWWADCERIKKTGVGLEQSVKM